MNRRVIAWLASFVLVLGLATTSARAQNSSLAETLQAGGCFQYDLHMTLKGVLRDRCAQIARLYGLDPASPHDEHRALEIILIAALVTKRADRAAVVHAVPSAKYLAAPAVRTPKSHQSGQRNKRAAGSVGV